MFPEIANRSRWGMIITNMYAPNASQPKYTHPKYIPTESSRDVPLGRLQSQGYPQKNVHGTDQDVRIGMFTLDLTAFTEWGDGADGG
jgi:hypothetical protein